MLFLKQNNTLSRKCTNHPKQILINETFSFFSNYNFTLFNSSYHANSASNFNSWIIFQFCIHITNSHPLLIIKSSNKSSISSSSTIKSELSESSSSVVSSSIVQSESSKSSESSISNSSESWESSISNSSESSESSISYESIISSSSSLDESHPLPSTNSTK